MRSQKGNALKTCVFNLDLRKSPSALGNGNSANSPLIEIPKRKRIVIKTLKNDGRN